MKSIILPSDILYPLKNKKFIGKRVIRDLEEGTLLNHELIYQDNTIRICNLKNFNYIENLVKLEKEIYNEFDVLYADKEWGIGNFTLVRPLKLELSFVALNKNNDLVGFWIGSNTFRNVAHTHRVAINSDYRSKSIGQMLYCAHWLSIINYKNIKMKTVEVAEENLKAQLFYQKLGYLFYDNKKTQSYIKLHGRKELVNRSTIVGNNNARSIVMGGIISLE